MNLDAKDVIEAVTDLLRSGYDHEYLKREGQLYDLTADKPIAAGDARVDGATRFESAPMRGTVQTSTRSPTGRPAARAVDRRL
jgi:hypothetical protein